MPGIVGIVSRMPRERAESELGQMLGVMGHESFYSTGRWIDDELGVYIGWTAQQGSFGDAGPQLNEAGDVALIFSGEEYPDDDTIARLKERGHRLGDGPSSHIVHLYEEDPTFPAGLNGLFQGVVADRRKLRVTLFNDRYGMHRLYYHESKEAVYFAAEAKAILAVCPELRTIDPRGLGESITVGCVMENRTLFKGVHVLPGGSLWTFRDGRIASKRTYFQPREWEEQPLLESEAFYERMREVFSRRLPRYFGGSQRIGVSLTGGLDSRMIMAWQKCRPGALPCYTWGGTYRDCQDVIVARQVARVCGQPHHVISMGKDFLSRFPYYADRAVFLTDGGVDAAAAADVYMNERARAIAPVRMTGLYGGEVLRRVRGFKPTLPHAGLFQPELLQQFRRATVTYDAMLRCHPLSFGVFRQAPWYHHGNLSLEQTQVTMRTPFLDNAFVKTVFQAPEAACRSSEASMRLIADGSRALSQIPTDRGLRAWGGLAARFSHRMHEFLFKAEYAYDYGMPQWLASADHLLAPLRLERLFLGRHKALHYRVWYRDALSGYVRDMLLDSQSLSRPYVERKMVERIVDAHVAGHRNYTTEIHKLLTLELVHRNFVDGPPAASRAAETPRHVLAS
jgi:asparagine synthase (glutamine-hydrolysing)